MSTTPRPAPTGVLTTRFAPSPTGLLHLGHAHAALTAWTRARQAGGRFLLRIEDIDQGRCRKEYARALIEDLAWLGLDWDGPVRIQSEHLPEYAAVLDQLRARGLLYPCFCTRAAIAREVEQSAGAPHAPDGSPVYPGLCRNLTRAERERRIASGELHAWRLDIGRALACLPRPLTAFEEGGGRIPCAPERFGDVVLARKDAPASYHLCVTHDDALQGVTLVTRGADIKSATAIHRLLQVLLGWPEPAYAHHPLLADERGRRLAKRDGAMALSELPGSRHHARGGAHARWVIPEKRRRE